MNTSNGYYIVVLVAICLAAVVSGRESTLRDHSRLFTREESIRIAGYGEEKLSTVVVTGTLLCTSSSSRRLHPIPISGALLGVTCKSNSPYTTRNKKASTWTKGISAKNGEFTIDLPSQLHAIPDLDKACFVKVLSLPKHSPCRTTKHKAHKIVLSSVGNGIRTYSSGALQFLHGQGSY